MDLRNPRLLLNILALWLIQVRDSFSTSSIQGMGGNTTTLNFSAFSIITACQAVLGPMALHGILLYLCSSTGLDFLFSYTARSHLRILPKGSPCPPSFFLLAFLKKVIGIFFLAVFHLTQIQSIRMNHLNYPFLSPDQ